MLKIEVISSSLLTSGVTKAYLERIYRNLNISQEDVKDDLNQFLSTEKMSTSQVRELVEFWGISPRTKEEVAKAKSIGMQKIRNRHRSDFKNYGKDKQFSVNDVLKLYNEDELSLAEIYKLTGVSPQTAKKFVIKNGGKIRMQQSHDTLLKDLEKAGFSEKDIRQRYQTENMLATDVRSWMSEIVKYEVGTKAFDTLLNRLDIKKTPEQIKYLRGAKSRSEKVASFERLSRAGFDTVKLLAEYFDKNQYLTYRALANQLNESLLEEDEQFTQRWLERHVTPLLSEKRISRVSREEMNFLQELKRVYPDSPITENTRSFIAPYELDALLPELSIAFEFNGDYWHSDKFLERNHGLSSVDYHVRKRQLCADKGVKLFFVWESDWINRQDDVVLAMIDVIVDPSLNPDILCRLEPTDAENAVELDEDDFVSEAV